MQVKYFSFQNLKLVLPQCGDEFIIHIYVDFTGCFRVLEGIWDSQSQCAVTYKCELFATCVIINAENGPHVLIIEIVHLLLWSSSLRRVTNAIFCRKLRDFWAIPVN